MGTPETFNQPKLVSETASARTLTPCGQVKFIISELLRIEPCCGDGLWPGSLINRVLRSGYNAVQFRLFFLLYRTFSIALTCILNKLYFNHIPYTPDTMSRATRRWVLNDRKSGIDGFSFESASVPHLGDQDVLVKMRGAALNYRDLVIAEGKPARASE